MDTRPPFQRLLAEAAAQSRHLCIGLDVDVDRIPSSVAGERDADRAYEFCTQIVDGTKQIAAAYKPNVAFFESLGPAGLSALARVVSYIHAHAPSAIVIADAKRGDIGSTNVAYVSAIFGSLNADAATVSPYVGREGLQPFLDQADRGIFVLCRTSNPGSAEFQDLIVDDMPLYRYVARNIARDWNTNQNCGLVVGATYPAELQDIREVAPTLPILIPGVGAQGGDLQASVRAASVAGAPFLLNVSRAVIYAATDRDYVAAATSAALEFDEQIRAARESADLP